MKRIFNVVLSLTLILGLASSCVDPVDLMTSDAKTGGLITCDGNFPYKLNATPQVDVDVNVLAGPEVTSVKAYVTFENKVEDEVSEAKLLATLDVAGANAADVVTKSYSVTYADISDLTFPTWTFPTDESELNIGDFWTIKYVSVMADGREVSNNNTTTISVANFFAGSYISTVWYDHPTAGVQVDNVDFKKDLLAISADECETLFGSWTDVQLFIKIDQTTEAVSVRSNEDEWDALHGLEEGDNSYDSTTGEINVWYGYTRESGTRKFHEKLVPVQ